MRTDCLMDYVALYKETYLALSGISSFPMGWKKHNPDGQQQDDVEAIDRLRVKWLGVDVERLVAELEDNLLSTSDHTRMTELYKQRLQPIAIVKEMVGSLTDYNDVFQVKVEALVEEMNAKNEAIANRLRPFLSEPQPCHRKRLMEITQESIDGLKEYFKATFKGMGNGNPDRFNEYLIPALKRCQTKKEIANLARACYESNSMVKDRKPSSWNKWLEVWCNLFAIDRLPYKESELEKPDYTLKYFWLQPPEYHR